MTVGCGNGYYYFEHQARLPRADYVFISNGEGTVAWMNLDGRDVRLRFVRRRPTKIYPYRFEFRWRDVSIVAIFEGDKPGEDSLSGLKIILRRGQRTKTVRALGESDC